ncbi:MAG TPA: hypothetical protein PKA17_11125 [Phenylobacterium sp.]|nr:hypothetical protein [Phenylobacterium sp.]
MAAYIGQNGVRNESVRLGYLADVHALDGDDNAGRSTLKESWRPVTPAPQRALIRAERPDTGPRAGSSGNANKTNPAATRAAQTWGMIGRGNALLAAAIGAYEVSVAEDKARAAAGVAGSTTGGVAGGIAGAEAGAMIGAPFFPGG